MAIAVNQSFSVVSTNEGNNTAVVRYVVTCSVSGESFNNYTQTGIFYIDGISYSSSYTLPRNSTTTVFSKDVTVGNASGRTIGASFSFPTTPSGGTKSGNTSLSIPSFNVGKAPNIISLSLKSRTVNSITCKFSVDSADTFYYRIEEGSWIRGSNYVTNGEFTIGNLSPNSKYVVHLLARNWINESAVTYYQSEKTIEVYTYDIGKLLSVNNFNHGDSIIVSISNPSGSSLGLVVKIGNTQILSRSVSAGNNTIGFNDSELDRIYKLYGSGNTLTATFILTTAGSYTNSKTCTITLRGNQKTSYVGQNGKKRAKVYVGTSSGVKKAVVWIGNNGRKRCI